MTSFAIDKVSWHVNTPGNTESREHIARRFSIFSQFLQVNQLTVRDVGCRESDIKDDFGIMSDDLTEEGLAVVKAAYDKWLTKVDNGMPPEDVTLLEKALKKIRGI